MKNTVKKILALVFVVAMVCSLAVPAFAAENDEYVDAIVWFEGVSYEVEPTTTGTTTTGLKLAKATIQSVIKEAVGLSTTDALRDVSIQKGKLVSVNGKTNANIETSLKNLSWVVALNGKIVSEDLSTVAVADGDIIAIYAYDSILDTKIVLHDASNIDAGVISFYYYDVEGNKKPLVGAEVELTVGEDEEPVKNLLVVETTVETEEGSEYAENGMPAKNIYSTTFTTDEKGQIWIAPQYLDATDAIVISEVDYSLPALGANHGLKDAVKDYYEDNIDNSIIDAFVNGEDVEIANMYKTAGATGDMTVVYVMVAAAAVITLGAVVIMKKKAVKAN